MRNENATRTSASNPMWRARRPVRRGAQVREHRAARSDRRVPRQHPHSEGILFSSFTDALETRASLFVRPDSGHRHIISYFECELSSTVSRQQLSTVSIFKKERSICTWMCGAVYWSMREDEAFLLVLLSAHHRASNAYYSFNEVAPLARVVCTRWSEALRTDFSMPLPLNQFRSTARVQWLSEPIDVPKMTARERRQRDKARSRWKCNLK